MLVTSSSARQSVQRITSPASGWRVICTVAAHSGHSVLWLVIAVATLMGLDLSESEGCVGTKTTAGPPGPDPDEPVQTD